MLKKIDNLHDLLNLKNQKNDFDAEVQSVLKIIKDETNLELDRTNIFIKNNNLKIKASSSIKFVMLLHLEKINQKIKSLNKNFILEL